MLALLLLGPLGLAAQSVGTRLPEMGLYQESRYGTVNLRIVDDNLRLYFLNEEGEVMAPPIEAAAARMEQVSNATTDPYIYMRPASSGIYLTSPRYIPKPYDYRVTLILFGESREVTEFVRYVGWPTKVIQPKVILPMARLDQS